MHKFLNIEHPGVHRIKKLKKLARSLCETQMKDLGVDAATAHPVQRELVRSRRLIGSVCQPRGWKILSLHKMNLAIANGQELLVGLTAFHSNSQAKELQHVAT